MNSKTEKNLEDYRGLRSIPKDFDEFWNNQLSQVEKQPVYQLTDKKIGMNQVNCFELFFSGSNGGKVFAKILLPNTNEKVPMIFHFHGYQGSSKDWSDYFKYVLAGYGVVAMDVRGQAGKSLDNGIFEGNTVKGQVMRGMLEGPEHLFFKDIFLDVYTVIEIIAQQDFSDEQNFQTFGDSQGGALAIVGAALNSRIKQVVAQYPFLNDFAKILEIAHVEEPYDELFRYFKYSDPLYTNKEKVLSTLDYIDVKNFAHRITGKVKLITGLRDVVCPPITQYAFYNRVETEKEHILVPEYGHEPMEVAIPDIIQNWLTGSTIN